MTAVTGVALGSSYSFYKQREQLEWELAQVAVHKVEAEAARAEARTLGRELDTLRLQFKREEQRQIDTIGRLNRLYDALRHELGIQEAQLIKASNEKLEGEQLREKLHETVLEREKHITLLLDEHETVGQKLDVMKSELQSVEHARDAAVAWGQKLEQQLEDMEIRLAQNEAQREEAESAFRSWVEEQIETIETTLLEHGVDAGVLMDRALNDGGFGQGGGLGTGQGGPMVLRGGEGSVPIALPRPTEPLDDVVGKLQAAQKLVTATPLLPPIDTYRLTSAFGDRRDPITGRSAFHAGMDLAAPRGTEILATASGRVTFAGRMGAYGNMVEVDHGMGLTTRYAHLKSVMVSPGDDVAFRQSIGVIGNTGRSTGRHLHYEIRIDDLPLDPANFIRAGRELARQFRG